ncbi:hypothetical protein H0E84_02960 [Luteimonas sp. SJ-92]|uniref:DUF4398 domain-containing protein n=1 Tax=Luteimonas salinisoli TaxID=2752307 RepID=A0A853J878_9GAMM|nr:hypothetical protein [Luteimonas salinisoli]NZA25331.1 hypothetical protein [Luteimonas salinisoli]
MKNVAIWLLLAATLCLPLAQAADDPETQALAARLQALDADPALHELAAYERLQARQALAAAAAARGNRADALQVARWRVEIAEIAARTGTLRREVEELDRQRSDLLVEASRQEAARARREAERLRVQAQIQAEEAARLRLAAEAESSARQETEIVLDGVASDQAARLRAARAREAELARREAELMREVEDEQ